MKILISGTSSGLGKFLHEYFKCDGIGRSDPIPTCRYDAIVHCAVKTAKTINYGGIDSYLDDNIELTNKLLSVPNNKFIYISTVDVYPKYPLGYLWNEEDEIILKTGTPQLSFYSTTKLISESLVTKLSTNCLILRCAGLLNPFSNINTTTMKIIRGVPSVSLSGDIKYNYVLADGVAEFIKIATSRDLCGIYNMASLNYIPLFDVARLSASDTSFGEYKHYHMGRASNKKVCKIAPFFNKTSETVVSQFVKSQQI